MFYFVPRYLQKTLRFHTIQCNSTMAKQSLNVAEVPFVCSNKRLKRRNFTLMKSTFFGPNLIAPNSFGCKRCLIQWNLFRILDTEQRKFHSLTFGRRLNKE